MTKIKRKIQNAIIILLLSVFFTPMVNAQENRHEVSLGYGIGSAYDLYNDINYEDGSPDEYDMQKHTRTFCMEYLYQREKKVTFGGTVCFLNQKFDHNKYRYYHDRDQFIHSFTDHYYKAAETSHSRLLLMPKMQVRWYNYEHAYMYSKIALGANIKFTHEEAVVDDYVADNNVELYLAGQITLLGVSVGSETFRFFAEVGYGCQAMLECGLSYRFGKITDKHE